MKKIFFAFLLFLLPLNCFASFSPDKWKYYKDMEYSGQSLVKFSLDDEIFTNANNDLSDLRVIDTSGQETPFMMVVGRDQENLEIFRPKMLNNTFVVGQNSSVILDMEEAGRMINQLKISTPSENFQRNVKVYGSDAMSDWKTLNDNAYVYDYTDKTAVVKTQNTAVNFPQSVFKYYKIEISDPDNSPIKIASVEAANYTKKYSKEIERNPKFVVSQNDNIKSTELIVDLGAKGIQTSKIKLNVSDKNFNRSILVYASNDYANWNYIDNSYIFRYNTPKFSGENMTLNFSETNNRYIKIVIANQDNQPLKNFGVITFSNYREIIFETKQGEKYQVFYGNDKANFPEYDLDKYSQYLDMENAGEGKLSVQYTNSKFVPEKEPVKPFTERYPYIMPGALAICGLLLLFLVWQFMKRK